MSHKGNDYWNDEENMKNKHIHRFTARREKATVLVCDCGRFQNIISKDNPAIVEQRKRQTNTNGGKVI